MVKMGQTYEMYTNFILPTIISWTVKCNALSKSIEVDISLSQHFYNQILAIVMLLITL